MQEEIKFHKDEKEKSDEQTPIEETKEEKKEEEIKEEGEEKKEIELKELKGVEIFAIGTHNGDKYSEKDLDQMVTSFKEIGDAIKPFVKIGHSEEQKLLAKDELPAAGWITNVYKKGQKLLCDVKDMPNKIYELIKNKAYKRVSAEIFWNLTHNGKKYPRVLRGFSILGGTTPAVTSLDDIHALYGDFQPIKVYSNEDQDLRTYEWEDNMEEIKKYQEQLEEKDNLIKELEEKKKESEEKLEQMALDAKKVATEIKIDEWINERKILPAQKELFFNLLMNLDSQEIEFGEKKFSREDLIGEIVSHNKLALNLEDEKTEQKEIEKPEAISIDELAEKYAEENNVDYKTALLEVAKQIEKGE